MRNVSAVIIASNEDAYIRKSITSVNWAGEIIVVVDEKSTDHTEKIARDMGVRVLKHPWQGYARQKNYGISKAIQDWILSIDADEIISAELAQEIINLKPTKDGYQFPFRNYLGNKWLKYGGLYPDYHLRLFRRDLGQFRGIGGGQIHETVQVSNIGRLHGAVDHYTYSSVGDFWQRVRNYAVAEGKQLSRTGRNPSLFDWVKIPLRFIKVYFFRLGLLDGWPGLVNAAFLSAYQYFKVRAWGGR